MTFRHLCLFKIIESLTILVALENSTRFALTSNMKLAPKKTLCSSSILTQSHVYTYLLTIFYFPSDLSACIFFSLSLFLSLPLPLTFLIDTKTARRVRQYSRRVVSFRLFRSRRGSVSLCALLIFLPLHYIRLCVYDCVCVCVLASLGVCQLLILYKRMRAYAHTLTHRNDEKKGTSRRWVEERQ